MKYILIFLTILTTTAQAQNYEDSTITVQMPRVMAWRVAANIMNGLNKDNYKIPQTLAAYVADSTKPDSLFTVTLKAKYIWNAIEVLTGDQCMKSVTDYLKIIYNQKVGATGNAISGYTSLQNQIVSKSNNANDAQRQTAIWLRDKFTGRQAALQALWREERDEIIKAVN